MGSLQTMLEEAYSLLGDAKTTADLDNIKTRYLGKDSYLVQQMQNLRNLDPEQKKNHGQTLNLFRLELSSAVEARFQVLQILELNKELIKDSIDISLPPREKRFGTIHPISKTIKEISDICASMGFGIADGPDIEDDFYNFGALNIADDHPARQMHDTFYMSHKNHDQVRLLRTHTSPVQIRTMCAGKPPFRFIAPGRVYRRDSDMTHTPMFHQIEGVCIDKDITMGHLKGCIEKLLTSFFEKKILMRFRPSFFPFTEPSAEVDIMFEKTGKWLEVMGCGMVHPKVLANVGVDANEYRGFAFGLGVERLTMLKHNITDLRTFFEGDIRWARRYGINFFGL